MEQAIFRTKGTLQIWWQSVRSPFLYGDAFGGLWGLLTAATMTYREWLVYDQKASFVYLYSDPASIPQAIAADLFFKDYNHTLLQALLVLLVLSGVAGWSTWQLSRVRPRGEEQPPLNPGTDWYLIGLAISGLCAVILFRALGLAALFKGDVFSFPNILKSTIGFLLPIYAGVALFLVWFRRLKSVRAPDWETHYPKPGKKASGVSKRRSERKKGGAHHK